MENEKPMKWEIKKEIAKKISGQKWFMRNYLSDGDFCFNVSSYVDTIKRSIGDMMFFDYNAPMLIEDINDIYFMVESIAKSWDSKELEVKLYG